LEIEVPDKWNKTPLHYAAQRSAAICTLYILQRGANIESKDIYGNNVLGISMLRRHFNYAILLIQKQANVCLPIYEEFPKRIAKMWEDEAKEKKR
jgi:ankyrin repeat protein